MTTKENEKRAKGEKVKLAITDANEQVRRMQEAVAHRAYAIFESRGSGSWHELQDWGQAESELVRPLNCGRTTVGDRLVVLPHEICPVDAVVVEGKGSMNEA